MDDGVPFQILEQGWLCNLWGSQLIWRVRLCRRKDLSHPQPPHKLIWACAMKMLWRESCPSALWVTGTSLPWGADWISRAWNMSMCFSFFLPYSSLLGCMWVLLGSQLLGLYMDSCASETPVQRAKAENLPWRFGLPWRTVGCTLCFSWKC